MQTSYKKVFQLAQDKGYKFTDLQAIFLRIKLLSRKQKMNDILIHLTIIQKWLRGEHKIFVSVKFDSYQPDRPAYSPFIKSLSSKNMGESLADGFLQYETYEQALLQGVHEALKLI